MLTRLVAAALFIAAAASAQALGQWGQRAPLPFPVTDASAASLGDHIYVACGILPDNSRSRRLFLYDVAADSWTERAPIPIDRGADHCNLAAVGDRLYLLGAIRYLQGFLTNRAYVYDPAANSWSELPDRMPVPRAASGVAVIGNRIYVAGGEAAQESGKAFAAYNLDTFRWERLPVLPEPRTRVIAGAVSGKVYVIGGRVLHSDPASVHPNVWEFTPGSGLWAVKSPMPVARSAAASAIVDGRILVFGGRTASGAPSSRVDAYDPATDSWDSLAAMPEPRSGLAAAADNAGRVYALAGSAGPQAPHRTENAVFHSQPVAAPLFSSDAVLSAASFEPGLAPGAIAALFGASLARGEAKAAAFPLPKMLNAVEIDVGGQAAPLLYTGPTQANFIIPWVQTGETTVTLRNAGLASLPVDITLQPAAPALFTLDQSGSGPGAILEGGTGRLAEAVAPGDVITIFGTGLGAVVEPPPAGEPAPLHRLCPLVEPLTLEIGGQPAEVLWAGLTPGLAGVYQINARIPAGASTMQSPIRLSVGSTASNVVTLPTN